MNIRTIIVDDEYLARRKLKTLLEPHATIQLLGEARNGKEALELIRLKEPDLVFLDIEMPTLSGIELAQQLPSLNRVPYIIFSTAYDAYAVKAFETEAIDYLLKPYEAERIAAALKRLHRRMQLAQAHSMNENIFQMLNKYRVPTSEYRQNFEIKKNGRVFFISNDEILFIQSEGNYVELCTRQATYLYRTTMNALASELDPKHFLRIHRSIIVNIHFIQSCRYQSNATYKFRLKNNQELWSGRSYKEQIAAFLGQ